MSPPSEPHIYNTEVYIQAQLQSLRISAITSSTTISLSGKPSEVAAFRDFIGSAVAITSLHVNAWYHGGEQLEGVVSEIIQDVNNRDIKFPSFTDLKTTLRSTCGVATSANHPATNRLAHWLIRQILVNPVDWFKIWNVILSSTQGMLKRSNTLHFKVISFGPGSESLFAGLISGTMSKNFETIELSPFKFNGSHYASTNSNDIAIVGMGVNFPKGKDQEELWATISKGVSAVSDVCSPMLFMFPISYNSTSLLLNNGEKSCFVLSVKAGAALDLLSSDSTIQIRYHTIL